MPSKTLPDWLLNTTKAMYYVYLIECEDASIYTGITTDIERRFAEHKNKIGGRYTRAHTVKKVLYTETHKTRSEALKREAEIKRWPKAKKLKLVYTGRINPNNADPKKTSAGAALGR